MRRTIARIAVVAASTTLLLAGGAAAVQAQHIPPLPPVNVRMAAGWGDNAFGQVGDGSFLDRHAPVRVGLIDVKKLAAGQNHSLAVKLDGTLWAWGDNQHRQLGIMSDAPSSPHPLQVLVSDVVDAAGGSTHSLALRSDGTVWGWGSNAFGQLGTGVPFGGHTTVPVRVNGLSRVIAIDAGAQHAIAIVFSTTGVRQVYTWGQNAGGQLGAVGLCSGIFCGVATPYHVPGLTGISKVAAGGNNSAAIRSDGTVYTWGSQGFGDPISTNPAITVRKLPSHQGVSVGVGYFHIIVVRPDGKAVAWGRNDHGQLGNGTNQHGSTPTVVSLNHAKQVDAGMFHSVAVHLDPTLLSHGG